MRDPGNTILFQRITIIITMVGFLVRGVSADQIPTRWDQLKRFHRDGQYGFYDKVSGEVVIPPQYDYATGFQDGLAMVKTAGSEGIIDATGDFKIGPFRRLFPFSEGLACAGMGGPFSRIQYGFINQEGRWEIPPQYDYAFDFSQGLAAVDKDGKFGYIDLDGKLVVPHQYSWAEPHHEGLAAVWKGNKVGFINLTGEIVISIDLEGAGYFSQCLAPVQKNGKWGYINSQGLWIIDPIYDEAGPFVNERAKVRLNNKTAYLSLKN